VFHFRVFCCLKQIAPVKALLVENCNECVTIGNIPILSPESPHDRWHQPAQLQAAATRPAVARRTTVRVQAQQAAPRAQASDRGR